MQEGMLFHSLLEPNSSVYLQQTSYRLRGKLEHEIVEKSLNQLCKRHDILRTAFVHEGQDQPLQVVLKERKEDFSYMDISERSTAEEKELFITRFMEKDRQHSFDLTYDPLMRVALIRVNPAEYEFIWSHHHILMDGWCTGILISEYFEIYNSFLEGRDYRLPPSVPYSGYIKWLQKQDKETSRMYWQTYLAHYGESRGLPKKKVSGPGSREYKNERVTLQMEKNDSARLARMAARIGVTVNTIIQSLWGIILGKYNGHRDVVFGAVVSGRPSEIHGIEQMVGLFINTIPVRITYNAAESFAALVRRMHENAIESEPHHYYPLADIQTDHPLKQNLFDHILIFQNFPPPPRLRGQLEVSNLQMFGHTSYDFNVNIDHGEQLRLSIQYNANVYPGELVNKIANHFITILIRAGENMDTAIENLAGVPLQNKRKEIMNQFNDDLENE
jgi:hypothetical protein